MSSWKIVAIHGLANKPCAEVLSARWQAALREGFRRNLKADWPANVEFEFVFWADLRHDPLLADDDPGYTDECHPGEGPLPEYRDSWRDVLRRTFRGGGGMFADIVGRAVGRDVLSDDLLSNLAADLNAYYSDASFRATLRSRLRKALDGKPGQKLILLSHSMGTIVALDVLRAAEKEAPPPSIALFVTMGSPLGLPYVIHRHDLEFDNPRTPGTVAQWANFSERRDRICFDAHLADDYRPGPNGVRVRDDLVINAVGKNRHLSYGYLRAPEFSRLLHGCLQP